MSFSDIFGGQYTFVTRGWRGESDGYAVVAWPGDTEGLKPRPDIDAILWPEPAALAPVDLAALREWLARVVPPLPPYVGPEPVKCPRCHGKGTSDCACRECGHVYDCTCDECDGEGMVLPDEPPPPPPVYVELLGGAFNGRFLARALSALPGDAGEWQRIADDRRGALLIVGEGWRYALMPVLLDPKDASARHAWPGVLP